jgi:hypothetical protein
MTLVQSQVRPTFKGGPVMNYKNLDTETLIEVATLLASGSLTLLKSGGWFVYDEEHATEVEPVGDGAVDINEALVRFIQEK